MKMRVRLMPLTRIPDGSQFYLYHGKRLYTLVTRNRKRDEAIFHMGEPECLLPGESAGYRYRASMYTGKRSEKMVWLIVNPGTSAP